MPTLFKPNTKVIPLHPSANPLFERWLALTDRAVADDLTAAEHEEWDSIDATLFPEFKSVPPSSWRQHYEEANQQPTQGIGPTIFELCLWIIAVGALSSPLWLMPMLGMIWGE